MLYFDRKWFSQSYKLLSINLVPHPYLVPFSWLSAIFDCSIGRLFDLSIQSKSYSRLDHLHIRMYRVHFGYPYQIQLHNFIVTFLILLQSHRIIYTSKYFFLSTERVKILCVTLISQRILVILLGWSASLLDIFSMKFVEKLSAFQKFVFIPFKFPFQILIVYFFTRYSISCYGHYRWHHSSLLSLPIIH